MAGQPRRAGPAPRGQGQTGSGAASASGQPGRAGPCGARRAAPRRRAAGAGGNRSGHGGQHGPPCPSRKLSPAGQPLGNRAAGQGGPPRGQPVPAGSTGQRATARGRAVPAGPKASAGIETPSRGQIGGPPGTGRRGSTGKARARPGRAQGRPCLARLESSARIDSIPRGRFGPPRGNRAGACARARIGSRLSRAAGQGGSR